MENGRYRARAIQGALGTTSTGKEQVGVEFQLMDAEGNPTERITWFGYFTDKTLERTVESLRHCGWQGDDLSDLTGIDQNEVSLVIEAEEYQGNWTPKVRWVNAPGSGLALANQLDANTAKTFAQRMRGQIIALGQGKPKAKTPAASAPPNGAQRRASSGPPSPEPPPMDDEIGF